MDHMRRYSEIIQDGLQLHQLCSWQWKLSICQRRHWKWADQGERL